jgi:hypothetical protein
MKFHEIFQFPWNSMKFSHEILPWNFMKFHGKFHEFTERFSPGRAVL